MRLERIDEVGNQNALLFRKQAGPATFKSSGAAERQG